MPNDITEWCHAATLRCKTSSTSCHCGPITGRTSAGRLLSGRRVQWRGVISPFASPSGATAHWRTNFTEAEIADSTFWGESPLPLRQACPRRLGHRVDDFDDDHSLFPVSHAGTQNLIEDTFLRPNTSAGWGTTTNNDGVHNTAWRGHRGSSTYATISGDAGVVTYPGSNGHNVTGYLASGTFLGGDVLAELSFSSVGHEVAGLLMQRTGNGQWYQADVDTSDQQLQIVRRFGNTSTTVETVPFTASANTDYWVRFDIQANGVTELLQARIWANGTWEPSNWQASYLDNTPLSSGYPGGTAFSLRGHTATDQVSYLAWSFANPGPATPPTETFPPAFTADTPSTAATVEGSGPPPIRPRPPAILRQLSCIS